MCQAVVVIKEELNRMFADDPAVASVKLHLGEAHGDMIVQIWLKKLDGGHRPGMVHIPKAGMILSVEYRMETNSARLLRQSNPSLATATIITPTPPSSPRIGIGRRLSSSSYSSSSASPSDSPPSSISILG